MGLEGWTIIIAFYALIATVAGVVVASRQSEKANALQQENNELERRNGDLQARSHIDSWAQVA